MFLPRLVTLIEAESRLMLYGVMYVLIMIFRPNGLIGLRRPRASTHVRADDGSLSSTTRAARLSRLGLVLTPSPSQSGWS